MSTDPSSKLQKPKNKFYFPYGTDEEIFGKNIQSNFPNLDKEYPELYLKIKKLPDFESNTDWLSTLCKLTNYAKHNNAIEITKDEEKVKEILISAGGFNLIQIGGEGSSVTFTNCRVNGQTVDDFIYKDGELKITKQGDLPLFYKITKDRKILVGENEIDLLPFLKKSIEKIEKFTDEFYNIYR